MVEEGNNGIMKFQTSSTTSEGFRCQVSEMIDLNTDTSSLAKPLKSPMEIG
jgi:hypothetical protein